MSTDRLPPWAAAATTHPLGLAGANPAIVEGSDSGLMTEKEPSGADLVTAAILSEPTQTPFVDAELASDCTQAGPGVVDDTQDAAAEASWRAHPAAPVENEPSSDAHNMTFGQALVVLKRGGRVSRRGWGAARVSIGWCAQLTDVGAIFLSEPGVRTDLWSAPQTDVLAEDWRVVG